MKYDEWKREIINSYIEDHKADMKLFDIKAIQQNSKITKCMFKANIFATSDNEILTKIFKSDANVGIIIGFGGNSQLHIGHYILVNEINFYLDNLKHVMFYFVDLQIDSNGGFIKEIIRLVNRDNFKYKIINYADKKILKLKHEISNIVNTNQVNRIMGWDNPTLKNYDDFLNMLCTFLISTTLKEKLFINITDINQKTFYAAYKNVEHKFKINNVCFLYHLLLPSIRNINERMSIKNPNSLILIHDQNDEKINKLKKAYTGEKNKELTCSFLRIADLMFSKKEINSMIKNCKNNTCHICKQKNIKNIIYAIGKNYE